ncbi:putative amino acid permease [Glonium stellatum]|uniref:Putative amino acid permease n=1 Tax=Glonium stellatum TaxID=574774 RepID=A0A8E2F5V5_9PEZI|nr:putative amino acid permease [Glonium stellatum]
MNVVSRNMWFALYNGGPQTFAWSVIIVYLGALAQAASLAEMASILPIAGAQYHWTHHLAPERWKSLVSLKHPDYVAKRWHLTLVILCMLFIQAFMNMYTFWIIPWVELFAGIAHVCLFIIFIVVLVTLGPRHNSYFIFSEQDISSGWSGKFVAWNLGMLTCAWSFTGFDGVLHMSEGVRKANQAVPHALFWTIALNGILAYAMVIAMLAAMSPVNQALSSDSPIIPILQSVIVCLDSVASVSRLTWAWSRDRGLPHLFSVICHKYQVLSHAIWLVAIVVGLLSLLNIGSTAAFGAITAPSSLALYFSCFIAISCMLHARFRPNPVKLGGWNLGRYGIAVNIFALIHTAWIMIFLPFSSTLPVTPVNMNYCGPIFAAVLIFTHWHGLNVEIIQLVTRDEENN